VLLRALIKLARPRDWLKQVFVLAPVPFAMAAGSTLEPITFGLGLLGFSLMTSAVYCYNDRLDVERDRLHPRKRERPIASGRVSEAQALGFAIALAAAGIALVAATRIPLAVGLVVGYVGLNLVYSHGGKHRPLIDVFLLSSNYVIRVYLGCALVAAVPSSWLLLCSSTLALFIGLAKRRGDLQLGMAGDQRPSLEGYTIAYLDQAMGITAGVAVLAYAIYSLEAAVFVPGREFAGLPFAAFVVLDYLRLSQVDMVLHEPTLIAAGVGFGLAVIWSLKLPF